MVPDRAGAGPIRHHSGPPAPRFRPQFLRPSRTGAIFLPVAGKQFPIIYMKKVRLEKVLWSLQELRPRVVVPEPVCSRAELAIRRMLSIS